MHLTNSKVAKQMIACLAISVAVLVCASNKSFGQANVKGIYQGYTMRLKMDNRGAFGRVSYLQTTPPADSLGLEYPLHSQCEHMYGAGVWVGGFVDTGAVPGTRPKVKAVTTAYEGYGAGAPLYEMFPSATDDWWAANRHQTAPPPGWVEYWGDLLPFKPISDNDLYCQYTDYYPPRPAGHIPLGIKVVQSSYAWDDPYAKAILINEYKIKNTSDRTIDSVYVGFFCDADVGPINITNYFQHNFTGYLPGSRTAYISNTSDPGSTPIGLSLLYPPTDTLRHIDSTRTDTVKLIRKFTFQWYPLANSPRPDGPKYDLMASGDIKPDEFPSASDTRFLFAFGPFQMKPDTVLKIAIGLVSGQNTLDLTTNASRAVDIYVNQRLVIPLIPPSPPLRVDVGFRRVTLNWKWRSGDNTLFGDQYTDPEALWDTTNQVARWDPARVAVGPSYPPVPLGINTSRGGRTFEAYRVWRSENPSYPAESFTLLGQFDALGTTDSTKFEYEKGLRYEFVDSNLVRGKTYVYSVTSKSIPNIVEQTIRIGDSVVVVRVPIEPRESNVTTNAVRVDLPFAVSNTLGKVSVVPNPYRTDRSYTLESGGYEGLGTRWTENERRIKFINLPENCTIRVFSLAGDLVRTIYHTGNASAPPKLNMQKGDEDMTLVSESNRALASGIYIFNVESNLGAQTGKFVIIR